MNRFLSISLSASSSSWPPGENDFYLNYSADRQVSTFTAPLHFYPFALRRPLPTSTYLSMKLTLKLLKLSHRRI